MLRLATWGEKTEQPVMALFYFPKMRKKFGISSKLAGPVKLLHQLGRMSERHCKKWMLWRPMHLQIYRN